MELRRWRDELDVSMVLAPAVFPAEEILSNRLVAAAQLAGHDAVRLTLEIGRSLWEQDKNIDDWDVLREAAARADLDADAIRGDGPGDSALDDIVTGNTNEAVDRGVFGAPSYVFEDGEVM
jgi:2-hydroxychromene-2-carboxylate isomerase